MMKQLDMVRNLKRRLHSPELIFREKIEFTFREQGVTVAAKITTAGAVVASIVKS